MSKSTIENNDDLLDLCSCLNDEIKDEQTENLKKLCNDESNCIAYVDDLKTNSFQCISSDCYASIIGEIERLNFGFHGCVSNNFSKCSVNLSICWHVQPCLIT